MDILKCLKLLILINIVLIICSCNFDKYQTSNNSFDSFVLENWESNNKPNKIELEKIKGNNEIKKESEFEIHLDTSRKVVFLTPRSNLKGIIDFDMILTIDDSISFNIENIKSSVDTTKRRLGVVGANKIIFNSIDTLTVNGNLQVWEGTSDIMLSMEMAKIQKDKG